MENWEELIEDLGNELAFSILCLEHEPAGTTSEFIVRVRGIRYLVTAQPIEN